METITKRLTCIGCPMGCALTAAVSPETGAVLSVSGNVCARGDAYARREVTNPTRVVTGTVRTAGGCHPVLAVKTRPEVPRAKVMAVAQAMRQAVVVPPVQPGDVILHNVADTGCDLVATQDL